MRAFIKTVLIVISLWIGAGIVSVMRATGVGTLPQFIVGIAMFAAIKAIWSYKPTQSKEMSLKKED